MSRANNYFRATLFLAGQEPRSVVATRRVLRRAAGHLVWVIVTPALDAPRRPLIVAHRAGRIVPDERGKYAESIADIRRDPDEWPVLEACDEAVVRLDEHETLGDAARAAGCFGRLTTHGGGLSALRLCESHRRNRRTSSGVFGVVYS